VTGLGQIALNSAPVFGGAMLAIAAGQFRGTDYRGLIKQDMDLLDRLPEEATKLRAELQRTIEASIDDLIGAADRGRALRRAGMSYQSNWRDIVTSHRAQSARKPARPPRPRTTRTNTFHRRSCYAKATKTTRNYPACLAGGR